MSTKESRKKLSKYISVMEEIKPLKHIPVFNANTFATAAEYFEIPKQSLYGCACYKNGKLKNYGIVTLTYHDFIKNGYSEQDTYNHNSIRVMSYDNFSLTISNCGIKILPDEAMLVFALSLKKQSCCTENLQEN